MAKNAKNPFGDVEMPPYFWKQEDGYDELNISAHNIESFRLAYEQGRDYAKKGSTAAQDGLLVMLIFFILLQRDISHWLERLPYEKLEGMQ